MANIVKEKLGMSENRKMSYEKLGSELGIQKHTVKSYGKSMTLLKKKIKFVIYQMIKYSKAQII